MMIPLYIPTNNDFPCYSGGAGICPSTVPVEQKLILGTRGTCTSAKPAFPTAMQQHWSLLLVRIRQMRPDLSHRVGAHATKGTLTKPTHRQLLQLRVGFNRMLPTSSERFRKVLLCRSGQVTKTLKNAPLLPLKGPLHLRR